MGIKYRLSADHSFLRIYDSNTIESTNEVIICTYCLFLYYNFFFSVTLDKFKWDKALMKAKNTVLNLCSHILNI